MVNSTLKARIRALESTTEGGLRGVLEYDEYTETLATALARAPGPGLYMIFIDKGNTLYAAAVSRNRTAKVHKPGLAGVVTEEVSW